MGVLFSVALWRGDRNSVQVSCICAKEVAVLLKRNCRDFVGFFFVMCESDR